MTTMVGEVANHIRQSAAMSSALPLPEDNIAAGLRIGVFGTSADPPHLGHMAIIEALSDSGNFDEIWVLPVYVHMMSGKNDHLSSFEHRFKMCEAAFNDSIIKSNSGCKIKVLPLERCASKAMDAIIANHAEQKRPRIGTKFIIDLIRTLYPSLTSLGLILGSDTFVDLTSGKWKDASTLLKNTALHVVSRPGSICDYEDIDEIGAAIAACTLVPHSSLNVDRYNIKRFNMVSSSAARSRARVYHSSVTHIKHLLEKEEKRQQSKKESDGKEGKQEEESSQNDDVTEEIEREEYEVSKSMKQELINCSRNNSEPSTPSRPNYARPSSINCSRSSSIGSNGGVSSSGVYDGSLEGSKGAGSSGGGMGMTGGVFIAPVFGSANTSRAGSFEQEGFLLKLDGAKRSGSITSVDSHAEEVHDGVSGKDQISKKGDTAGTENKDDTLSSSSTQGKQVLSEIELLILDFEAVRDQAALDLQRQLCIPVMRYILDNRMYQH